jgi:hypothetical protein
MIKKPFILGYGGLDSSGFRLVAERFQRERQDKFVDTVDAVARATGQKIDAAAFAKQVHRAAAKARGELLPEPQKLSPMAQAVLRAAAKARGEVTDDAPRFSNDEAGRRAKMICNAARKARGQEPFE